MPPIFYSEPSPKEKLEHREDGEGGENGEGQVENPNYNPGFDTLGEVQFQGDSDKLVEGTIEDQQENVVAKNFTEQRAQNISIEDQKHTVKANYNGEQAIIESGRDKDPSIEDAVKSATSDEGDPLMKKQALDSFITRQAMYADVLGDQVARGKDTSKEEASKASSELDTLLSVGNSALNRSSGETITQESQFTDEHLKRTLDEAEKIKTETDAKLNGETGDTTDGTTDEETEYETVEPGEDATEDTAEETPETTDTPDTSTSDTSSESQPAVEGTTSPEQKTDQHETEYAMPVFLSYDDQRRDDPGEVIYSAMTASPEDPQKKKSDETKEDEQK